MNPLLLIRGNKLVLTSFNYKYICVVVWHLYFYLFEALELSNVLIGFEDNGAISQGL